MIIRHARMSDLDELLQIENACFPKEEAVSREALEQRLKTFPDHFWLMEMTGSIVGFVNGMATDERELRDEMYSDASLHNDRGAWQMIFGVDTIPQYRNRGYASQLITRLIEDSRADGRRGVVLTCKQHLIKYYEKFGFVNEGISSSVHGGAVWYSMRLEF